MVKRKSSVALRPQAFAGEQLGYGLAAAHFEGLVAIDQHFGAAATGVVVGAHDETIGARGANGQQVAFGQVQGAVLGEEVAGLADRPDHVVVAQLAFAWLYRADVHPGLVQGRADQVVHRRVDDGEILVLGVLEVLHAGQQHAGVGHDVPARFEDQGQIAVAQALAHGLDVVAGQGRDFIAVAHAEAAAQVQVIEQDAAIAETVDQHQDAVEGVEEGLQRGQLRTDMAVDPDDLQVR